MFCAPELIFGGVKGIRSLIQVLRSMTLFRQYRGHPVPSSCFALLDSFLAVFRASGPIFMFCASGLVFCGSKGVGSRFHALRSRTLFWRYRGLQVHFLCFTLLDPFSAVQSAKSNFIPLRFRTHFRRYRDRRVQLSCLSLPYSFSAVPRPSGPVFMLCAPEHVSTVPRTPGLVFMFCALRSVFSGMESVGSSFHVMRFRTRFRRYRGR
jgi:hypothetical protein